ncbi:MAG: hypothetical protein PHW91_01440, partial [Bacteroidales bacterium]|nr:hypothetical protein [Bacteroidales bacterium]
QQGVNKMQAISGLENFVVSIQLAHRGTMTMFQPPALYQPPAVSIYCPSKLDHYTSIYFHHHKGKQTKTTSH